MDAPAVAHDGYLATRGEEYIVAHLVSGVVSVPDCNVYKNCEVCDRGNTSTGIECPNCGHVNLP